MTSRVVFDTNVWTSVLMWHGDAYRCLLLAKAGVVQIVDCRESLAELSTKLRERFGFSENAIHAVVYEIQRVGEAVIIRGDLRVVASDADDDKFVECAQAGRASFIVSGDHHLLELGAYAGIHIVTPGEALRFLAKNE